MPILYDISASVDCQGTAAVAKVRYTKNPNSTGVEGSAKTWRLYDASGSYDVTQASTGINQTVSFTVPADGPYVISLDSATANWGEQSVSVACNLAPLPALVLDSLVPTNATATGGGSITGQASGGVAPLSFSIPSLGITVAATSGVPVGQGNIPPGTYFCRFVDAANQQVSGTVTIAPYVQPVVMGCTDPAATNYDPAATQDNGSCQYAPPVRVAYFEVPPMQSLRFVQPLRLDKPAFDNTLLADARPLDYENPGYCQLVEQADKLVIQILSNYAAAPVLVLRESDTGASKLSVPAVQVQQGAGVTQAFDVYAKADPVAGFTRVYFNADALPLPFLPGQRVTIGATGTALDGTYPIHDVLEDVSAAVPYLRLAKPYPSGLIRLDGSLTTTYVVQQYDTYHAVIDFATVAPGCYYAEITATDPDFAPAYAKSEPIDLALQHNALQLVYRNFDNAHGLNYSAHLVNRLRFKGRFFDLKPATEKTVLRNDNKQLVLLTASPYRKVELEALLLPGWLHEVIAVAFCHDFVTLEGVEVILEGDYTYEDVERYTLGKGTALVEVVKFLGVGNRDDLGDVDQGGPYLLANSDFLLARK